MGRIRTTPIPKRAKTLSDQGNYQEAITCCDKALQIDANCIIAHFDKGLCLHYLGKYEEALKCYDKGLEIANTYYKYDDTIYNRLCAMFYDYKAKSLLALGRVEEANQYSGKVGESVGHTGDLDTCQSNLKNLATGCEMFRDQTGRYPSSLDELLKPVKGKAIFSSLPTCPIHKLSYEYHVYNNPEKFIIKCTDKHVKDSRTISPSYNSLEGLKL